MEGRAYMSPTFWVTPKEICLEIVNPLCGLGVLCACGGFNRGQDPPQNTEDAKRKPDIYLPTVSEASQC